MTKRGIIILFVLVAVVGGAIGGIIMFLSQQEAAEPSPAVTLSETGGCLTEVSPWTVAAGLFAGESVSGLTAG